MADGKAALQLSGDDDINVVVQEVLAVMADGEAALQPNDDGNDDDGDDDDGAISVQKMLAR